MLGDTAEHDRWLMQAILESPSRNPNHAWMPQVRADNDDVALLSFLKRRALSIGQHLSFACAAFLVQRFQCGGEFFRFFLVLRGKQLGRERSIANAPARIDARPEDKAEIVDGGFATAPRVLRKRDHADVLAVLQDLQPL